MDRAAFLHSTTKHNLARLSPTRVPIKSKLILCFKVVYFYAT